MNIFELAKNKVVILDGAMGTSLLALNLPQEAYGGYPGCNEYLAVSAPEAIYEIHKSYLDVGADVIETNTFGAIPVVLREYGLEAKTVEINAEAARVAKKAADKAATPTAPCFVAGSIGPGTKLPSLGQILFDELYEGYARQVEGLIAGGVDLLMIETCQDLLQVKSAIIAARDVMAHTREVPIYVSVTVEQSGTLLTGSDMATVISTLAPLDVEILGMNCATGPSAMRPHLEVLAKLWHGYIGVYPNAGLPMATAKGVVYPEAPDEFAGTLAKFVKELPINFAGGCCGTTPEHIKTLAKALRGVKPKEKYISPTPAVASLFSAVNIKQEIPPLFVGERANATGSKAFRDALLAKDYERAFDLLSEQEEYGSHAADISVAYAGLDELKDMQAMVARAAKECRLPLCIDSNRADVVTAALKLYGGRPIINSINLEDGGARADKVCALAKRFGSALICLTIDEAGMALKADKKVEVAKRLVELCVGKHGLHPGDLFIDALTFTIGSGDPSLENAAQETLNAVAKIKDEIPGVHTLLGVSNVSYGLSARSRRVLNSVFLDLAVKAGLDAAIINPKLIIPLASLDESDKQKALDLIYNRKSGDVKPLEAFINHFADKPEFEAEELSVQVSPETAVAEGIIKGSAKLILNNLPALLTKHSAEEILNDFLVPAMKKVGELFGAGQIQLPFVLKSAEAMKQAVDFLHPHFKSLASANVAKKKLLIATVRGDVHDIGKNLVNIILSNNGFEVIDLGTKVPVDVIISEAKTHKPDAIGMSGLLVTSAMTMAENLRAMSEAGITAPVLVGGAALTPVFAGEALQPSYGSGKVEYCRDAFDGLKAMQRIAEGKPLKNLHNENAYHKLEPVPATTVESLLETVEPPEPAFLGARTVDLIPLDSIFNLIDKNTLFKTRWKYRKGEMSPADYKKHIAAEIEPKYRELQRIIKLERLFRPKAVYGWFNANGLDNKIVVKDEEKEYIFEFPRQNKEPHRSITDFVRPDGDVVGFFVVTLGGEVARKGKEVLQGSHYLDYFLLHGLAVEATDALAEYLHEIMRRDIGFEKEKLSIEDRAHQKYRGGRYAFGYPTCPDLSVNKMVFELLRAEEIGVALTENYEMVPEFSTSAIVLHHPQAKYFGM